MGLLLGGSILTVFEVIDLLLYNWAWKTGHKMSNANKLQHTSSDPDSTNKEREANGLVADTNAV